MRQLHDRPPDTSQRLTRAPTDAHAREVAEGVWSLQLPLRYLIVASVNAYLLRTVDGFVLWDCGSCLEPGWDSLEHALGQVGVTADQITMLIVSHAHSDHRGLAAEFVARTGARLASAAGPHPVVDLLRDFSVPLTDRRRRALSEGVPAFAVDALVNEMPGMDGVYPSVEADLVLEPGATVETLSGRWEVVALPGHGSDQIGLWNAGRRDLISADLAFAAMVSYLEYGTRPDPQADQVRSLDQAIALEPQRLLAGHGRPAGDATALLRNARERVLERVQIAATTLREGPMTAWDVAVTVTPPGVGTDHYQRSLSETLCVLEHLERRGVVRDMPDDRGRRIWELVPGREPDDG